MKRILSRHRLSWLTAAGVAGVAAFLLARAVADSKRPAPPTAPSQRAANSAARELYERIDTGRRVVIDAQFLKDVTKGTIELPAEQLLAAKKGPAAAPPAPRFDRPKSKIEGGTQRLLANQTSVQKLPAVPQPFVNPKVEPGKVRWHKTFADACAVAQKSGKSVLLFQMMGNLDDRFC